MEYLISMGSNEGRAANMALARRRLAQLFADIRFSAERETEAGRLPQDKPREIVRLDLDLLMCDGRVLKPADMERAYVRQGMEELKMENGEWKIENGNGNEK